MTLNYDHKYPTCEETHVTLRIYSEKLNPLEITRILKIQPTSTQNIGDKASKTRNVKINGWFLESENNISSNDARAHIDFITEKLLKQKPNFQQLKNEEVNIDICCYWQSKDGHGGPTLLPKQLKDLSEVDVEFWFDFY